MQRQVPRQIPQIIGSNIRAARKRRHLTQHELATLAGTQAFQVSRWEKGLHRPKDEMLAALAHVLGMELADFFADDEPEREAA
jgi:transcriptional regulator with XRE-family HTH domain